MMESGRPDVKEPAPTAPTRWRQFLLPALLIAAIALAFWNVPRCDFVGLDDGYYVTRNTHVRTGLTIANIHWAFTDASAYWIPMTWLSLMLDQQLLGPGPLGFHLTNLVLHIANALLLYWFLRAATGSPWRSALAAALFAIHPLRVESVAWVSERKDVLCTLFGLAALIAYGRFARVADRGARNPWAMYTLVMLLLALSLWAKPMLVTFPFLLLLLDAWPLRRLSFTRTDPTRPPEPDPAPAPASTPAPLSRLLLEKLPLLALAGIFSIVTFRSQSNTGAVRDITTYGLSTRLSNGVVSYARYLGKTFWFGNLAVPYPYPHHWPAMTVVGATALLLGISAVVLWRLRRQPFLAVGWCWFLGTLVPVIGIVQSGDQSMADRFTYFPAIGLAIMAAYAIPQAWVADGSGRFITGTAAIAALLVLGCFSFIQVGYWKNSIALYRHAVTVTHDNFVAHDMLGTALAAGADPHDPTGVAQALSEAAREFRAAIAINWHDGDGRYALGKVLVRQGQFGPAAEQLGLATRLRPENADAHAELGYALVQLGQPDKAIVEYQRALEHQPENPAQIELNLGNAYLLDGDPIHAIEQGRKALAIDANFVAAHALLGQALATEGRFDDALGELEIVRAQRPDDPNVGELIDRVKAAKAAGNAGR